MMPPGGEGMPGPFPQGGAEQAPPTPDGLPPMQFGMGRTWVRPRLDDLHQLWRELSYPAASRYAQSANAALGRMFMNPNVYHNPFLRTCGVPVVDMLVAAPDKYEEPVGSLLRRLPVAGT
jgi:hypothetical protein